MPGKKHRLPAEIDMSQSELARRLGFSAPNCGQRKKKIGRRLALQARSLDAWKGKK
jgi:DNA-binding Lrp family transcriptional regulator